MTPRPNNFPARPVRRDPASHVVCKTGRVGEDRGSLNLSETELARITSYVHGIMRWSGAGSVKTERERV